MAFHLSEASIQLAIRHLTKFGDTDVFPHLPEIAFLKDREAEVVNEIGKFDLDNFTPSSAFEALAPKSRFGFRIVHQMPLLDTLLFLAALIEIGPEIEAQRNAKDTYRAFSYRFLPEANGSISDGSATYKAWLKRQLILVKSNLKIKQIVFTDISDFYARINFHRLENLLDDAAPKHGAARYLKKHIKTIRAKQSFGLPVGGAAARLLAELALSDTDQSLEMDGLLATRYVDDFRIFLEGGQDPYDALALLAEQLGINEGLALNAAKTRVLSRTEFLFWIGEQAADISDAAEGEALDALIDDLYSDEEPDPEELEKLKHINLLGMLQEEVGKDSFDMGRIKFIFRALRVAKPEPAIDFLKANLKELVVFAREMVLLMQELETDNNGCFDDLHDEIISVMHSPPASSIQLSKTWLFELFVRGVVPLTPVGLKELAKEASSNLDERQLLLARSQLDDKNFYRKSKTGFTAVPPSQQPCLIWGASCLPKDEYEKWLDHIKPHYSQPLGHLFLAWARKSGNLSAKLSGVVDHDHD